MPVPTRRRRVWTASAWPTWRAPAPGLATDGDVAARRAWIARRDHADLAPLAAAGEVVDGDVIARRGDEITERAAAQRWLRAECVVGHRDRAVHVQTKARADVLH